MSGGTFDHNLAGIQHGQSVKWDANLCALVPADFQSIDASHGQLRATAGAEASLTGAVTTVTHGSLSAEASAESSLDGTVT